MNCEELLNVIYTDLQTLKSQVEDSTIVTSELISSFTDINTALTALSSKVNDVSSDIETLTTGVSNIDTSISLIGSKSDDIYTHVYAFRMQEFPAYLSAYNANTELQYNSLSALNIGQGDIYSSALKKSDLDSSLQSSLSSSLNSIKTFLGLED